MSINGLSVLLPPDQEAEILLTPVEGSGEGKREGEKSCAAKKSLIVPWLEHPLMHAFVKTL